MCRPSDFPPYDEPDEDDGLATWQTYDVVPDGAGGAHVHAATNDNLDTGYPSEFAEWHLHFRRLADALRHTGVCRTGVSGVRVTVTLNGERLTEAGRDAALEDADPEIRAQRGAG